MGYNKKILITALEEVKEKGKNNRRRYDAKRQAIEQSDNRLTYLDNEIMKLGPMIGISALSGNNDRVKAIKEKVASLSAEREALLLNAGLGAYLPVCSHCNDTGYIGTKLCHCVLSRAKELSYKALSEEMPIEKSGFENFSLNYYEGENKKVMEKIYNFLNEYADNLNNKSSSLLFLGGTGLGKTHLSLAIAKKSVEKGLGTIYSPTQNLLHKLEKEHFSYSDETPLMDDVMGCDLLILDDLGAEFSTSFTGALIYNIINTRILAERPTIISTNLSMEEIEKRYTPRVASRIIGCYVIKKFVGEDIRQKKRIEEIRERKANGTI